MSLAAFCCFERWWICERWVQVPSLLWTESHHSLVPLVQHYLLQLTLVLLRLKMFHIACHLRSFLTGGVLDSAWFLLHAKQMLSHPKAVAFSHKR